MEAVQEYMLGSSRLKKIIILFRSGTVNSLNYKTKHHIYKLISFINITNLHG